MLKVHFKKYNIIDLCRSSNNFNLKTIQIKPAIKSQAIYGMIKEMAVSFVLHLIFISNATFATICTFPHISTSFNYPRKNTSNLISDPGTKNQEPIELRLQMEISCRVQDVSIGDPKSF